MFSFFPDRKLSCILCLLTRPREASVTASKERNRETKLNKVPFTRAQQGTMPTGLKPARASAVPSQLLDSRPFPSQHWEVDLVRHGQCKPGSLSGLTSYATNRIWQDEKDCSCSVQAWYLLWSYCSPITKLRGMACSSLLVQAW